MFGIQNADYDRTRLPKKYWSYRHSIHEVTIGNRVKIEWNPLGWLGFRRCYTGRGPVKVTHPNDWPDFEEWKEYEFGSDWAWPGLRWLLLPTFRLYSNHVLCILWGPFFFQVDVENRNKRKYKTWGEWEKGLVEEFKRCEKEKTACPS